MKDKKNKDKPKKENKKKVYIVKDIEKSVKQKEDL